MIWITHRYEDHYDYKKRIILKKLHCFTDAAAVCARMAWSEDQFARTTPTEAAPHGWRHMIDGHYHWFASSQMAPMNEVTAALFPWQLVVHPGDGTAEPQVTSFPAAATAEELSAAIDAADRLSA